MANFLKGLLSMLIGGAITGGTVALTSGGPITGKAVGISAGVGALTVLGAYFKQPPTTPTP